MTPQQNASATTSPSPELSESELRLAVADRVHELVHNSAPASPFDYHAAALKELQDYSGTPLRNIATAIQESSELAEGVAAQISAGYNPYAINDAIHLHRKTEAKDYLRTVSDVSALYYYERVNVHDDLSIADEDIQQQCIALMKFARRIDTLPQEPSPFLDYTDGLEYDLRIINDEGLVNLIANRPGDVEKIAEIVIEYRTSDAATVNGILEGELPPLANGHL